MKTNLFKNIGTKEEEVNQANENILNFFLKLEKKLPPPLVMEEMPGRLKMEINIDSVCSQIIKLEHVTDEKDDNNKIIKEHQQQQEQLQKKLQEKFRKELLTLRKQKEKEEVTTEMKKDENVRKREKEIALWINYGLLTPHPTSTSLHPTSPPHLTPQPRAQREKKN